MTKLIPMPPNYASWLADLKSRIASAQFRATLAVNSELVLGVAEYQLTQAIPPEFAGSLPTIEQLEAALQGDLPTSITDTGVP